MQLVRLRSPDPLSFDPLSAYPLSLSQVTASRQLNDLVKKGVLQKVANQKARSSAYELCL